MAQSICCGSTLTSLKREYLPEEQNSRYRRVGGEKPPPTHLAAILPEAAAVSSLGPFSEMLQICTNYRCIYICHTCCVFVLRKR